MAGYGFYDDTEQEKSPLSQVYTPGAPAGISYTPDGQPFVDGKSSKNYSLPPLKPDQGLSSPSYNPASEMFAGISPEGMASPLKAITPPSTSVKSPLNYPKDSIYGVPISDLTRVLGTTAHAIAPNSWGGRLGKGMSELADQDEANRLRQQQLNQNYEMGMGHVTEDKRMGDLRLRQFDLAEKKMQEADEQVKYQNDLVDSIANDPVAVKEIATKLNMSEETTKGLISSHKGEMFKNLPAILGSAKKSLIPEQLLTEYKLPSLIGQTWESAGPLVTAAIIKRMELEKPDKDSTGAKSRTEFETRYPKWQGLVGTPEYAKAIREWENKTAEKLQIAVTSANERGKYFSSIPTGTPGVIYDRAKHQYSMKDESGREIPLSSKDVMDMNLQYKEDLPTTDIRVMQQSVPSVLQLIKQTRQEMAKTVDNLGPAKGRWRELWSGKIGNADPDFRKLSTDIGLLETRLMRMHVGARGGVEILKHFKEMINAGKDSPENMMASLDSIETYANEVASPIKIQRESSRPGPSSPGPKLKDPLGLR
jgi:hypothetical protein